MESFALTLFVLCTSLGLLTVAVAARWLRSQPRSRPDITIESVPPTNIVTALAASNAVSSRTAFRPDPGLAADDDPTQPMTRTQALWGSDDSSDWPTTVLEPGQAPDRRAPRSEAPAGFADTQPLPLQAATASGA